MRMSIGVVKTQNANWQFFTLVQGSVRRIISSPKPPSKFPGCLKAYQVNLNIVTDKPSKYRYCVYFTSSYTIINHNKHPFTHYPSQIGFS
jgi:hypothetical protein